MAGRAYCAPPCHAVIFGRGPRHSSAGQKWTAALIRNSPEAPMTGTVSAEKAQHLLIEGNERFRAGGSRFKDVLPDELERLAKGQRPFATILGCSDSRVPPELIFDAVLGELFVIRVAGNIMSAEIAGSLQYAGVHLRTPLFVVL